MRDEVPGFTMRYLIAAAIVLAYIVFTVMILRAHRRKAERKTAAGPREGAEPTPVLIAFASQAGYAEQIAWQTASSLQAANVPMRVRSFADLSMDELSAAERALFVVSTYGEGDPPDVGQAFVNRVMSGGTELSRLGYGVLALGDRTYRNFCGFGKTLDGWLKRQSAVPLFDLVEVDNADEGALRLWQRQLIALTGHEELPEWVTPANTRWRLARRELVNEGSAGEPCYHIELVPFDDDMQMDWVAGDIAVIALTGAVGRLGLASSAEAQDFTASSADAVGQASTPNTREYSIASLPSEGGLHILVRQSRRADGSLGMASGWLTQGLETGSEVELRIRRNSNFHAPDPSRPMILIGNGTGIAGLRSHIEAREHAGAHRNWLIFGERNARHDSFYREDIQRWQRQGVLARTDFAFSRDQPERLYVQHVIHREERSVRDWVAEGAAIYVCGSAEGMSPAVEAALTAALGRDLFDQLIAEHRFRRDVY